MQRCSHELGTLPLFKREETDCASQEMCRLCLNKVDLTCIFLIDDGISLDVKAMTCAVVQIARHDGLPSMICKSCKTKLCEFYDFKKKCESTEVVLRTLIKSDTESRIKLDPDADDSNDMKSIITVKSETDVFSSEYVDEYIQDPIHNEKYYKNDDEVNNPLKTQDHKDKIFFPKIHFGESENDTCQNELIRKEWIKSADFSVNIKKEVPQKILGEMKSFNINDALKISSTSFQCELCGCIYKTKSILKKHLLTHTSEKPFNCSLCTKFYTRKEHLVVHMRTHSGVKPFVCEMCARPFAKNQDLSRHRRIHFDEKQFKCPRCEKTFKRSADVHKHMRTHTGVRLYVCKGCSKSYTSHSGLRKHGNTCKVISSEKKHSSDKST